MVTQEFLEATLRDAEDLQERTGTDLSDVITELHALLLERAWLDGRWADLIRRTEALLSEDARPG